MLAERDSRKVEATGSRPVRSSIGGGFRQDAEGAGKVVIEIVARRRPKVWRDVFETLEDETAYVKWAATWAFHWAAKVGYA